MRRWPVMAIVLAVLSILPQRGTEIGELKPVEVLFVFDQNGICIETDTNDRGSGATLEEALVNLRDTTPGNIYLNTVEYLILTKDTMDTLPELKKLLRPSVKLCVASGKIEMAGVAEYLKAHPPKSEMMEHSETISTLMVKEGRFYLNP